MLKQLNIIYPRTWQEARLFFKKKELELKTIIKNSDQFLLKKVEEDILRFIKISKEKAKESEGLLLQSKQQNDKLTILKSSNDFYFYNKNLNFAKNWLFNFNKKTKRI